MGKRIPAYDSAWVEKIPALDGSHHPHFPQTLHWILQNQLEDGSWGLSYDRVLATLACIITLIIWRTGQTQVQKGLQRLFINKNMVYSVLCKNSIVSLRGICTVLNNFLNISQVLNSSKNTGQSPDFEADNHRPSGFEIVFTAMLNEAKHLCLDLPYELPFIKQIIEKREATLKRLNIKL